MKDFKKVCLVFSGVILFFTLVYLFVLVLMYAQVWKEYHVNVFATMCQDGAILDICKLFVISAGFISILYGFSYYSDFVSRVDDNFESKEKIQEDLNKFVDDLEASKISNDGLEEKDLEDIGKLDVVLPIEDLVGSFEDTEQEAVRIEPEGESDAYDIREGFENPPFSILYDAVKAIDKERGIER